MLALFGEGRCPSLVRQKTGVATAALAGLSRQPAVAVVKEVDKRFAACMIKHDGAFRHLHFEISPTRTVPVATGAMAPVLAFAMRMIAKGQQRRDIAIGDKPDRPAVATIAAVRTAFGDMCFTPERNTAGATVAALNVDVALIDEVGHPARLRAARCDVGHSPHAGGRLGSALMQSERDLTEIEAAWGTTMRGHAEQGIERAHGDSHASVAPGKAMEREAREAVEEATLRPGATRSQGAGDRLTEEAPDQTRTCFERDRDRILHAASFRRLAGKTQVFVFPDDHQRTRLTHALEVTQVARSVSWALGLNVPLTEAIALGHDCGHGPGGHASEDALAPYVEGGFNHAVWGADVTLKPLNLCSQTLDGIRNHSWSRPAPQTPEGEVVSWADRIAYVCHDFEDAVTAGVVRANDLPDDVRSFCGTSRRTQLAGFIGSMIEATERTGLIGMTPPGASALSAFRAFNYENIYLRDESRDQAHRVVTVLQALVEHLSADPARLPARMLTDDSEAGVRHAAVRWVAGMTDRYAINCAQDWLGFDAEALPRGIDAPG